MRVHVPHLHARGRYCDGAGRSCLVATRVLGGQRLQSHEHVRTGVPSQGPENEG